MAQAAPAPAPASAPAPAAAAAPIVDESKLPEWVKRQARSPYKVIIESQVVKPKPSPSATQSTKDDEAARRVAKKATPAALPADMIAADKARPVAGSEAVSAPPVATPDSGNTVGAVGAVAAVAAVARPMPTAAPVIEQTLAAARPLLPEPLSAPVLAAPPEPPPLQLLDGGDPVIPADAFDNQRSRAEVVVRFTVTPNGEVSKLTVMSSNNARLNRSVLRAVQGWRYAPIAAAREHNVSFAFTPQ